MSDQVPEATPGQPLPEMPATAAGLAAMRADSEAVPISGGPRPGSLEDRIAKRRAALEGNTTELFDVPNFQGVFKVELRVLGGKQQYRAIEKHARVQNEYQQNLRSATDLILAATVGIHAVIDPDEDTTQLAEGFTWLDAAKALDKNLDATTPPKAALVRVLGEAGVISLFGEWERWTTQRGAKVDEELVRD